jgi:hypothetical protein
MGIPTVLSYTILDGNGVKASAPFYAIFDDAVAQSDFSDIWVALGALVDAVSGGVILGGSVALKFRPDGGWKSSIVAGSDVSDALNLNYSNPDTLQKSAVIVPMLRTALISDARPIIASGAIKNLSDYLLAAGVDPTYDFCNPAGQDLLALVDAFQSDRKHRRQLKANSTVLA